MNNLIVALKSVKPVAFCVLSYIYFCRWGFIMPQKYFDRVFKIPAKMYFTVISDIGGKKSQTGK